MLHEETAVIDQLPDQPLPENAPVCAHFHAVGCTTFRAACRWTRDQPYGKPSQLGDPTRLFIDGHGNCLTKHAAVAAAAIECGLDISHELGFYRLCEDIIAGIDAVLAPAGLSWIPQLHCFLVHEDHIVDLTEGNCHGKRRLPDDYLIRVQLPHGLDDAGYDQLYRWALQHCRHFDHTLAALPEERILELLDACLQINASTCTIR